MWPTHSPVVPPGEATVGDEQHLLAQPRALDGTRDREHLAHAGPTLGALVADHHAVAGLDLPGLERIECRALTFKHPCGRLEHVIVEAADSTTAPSARE